MYNSKHIYFFLHIFLVHIGYGQDYGPEPKWSGEVVYIDSLKSQIDLESQRCYYRQVKSKASYVTGVNKIVGTNCVSGQHSTTPLPSSDTVRIIARHTSNSVNPKLVFNIFKLESEKGKDDCRCVEVVASGSFSGTVVMDLKKVPFYAEKYKDSSYLIKIPGLNEGNYALTFEGSRDFFHLFSIEEPNLEEGNNKLSKGDTIYFKVSGAYVEGTVCSVEKYGVKANYLNGFNKKKTKYVNFEYIKLIDPSM